MSNIGVFMTTQFLTNDSSIRISMEGIEIDYHENGCINAICAAKIVKANVGYTKLGVAIKTTIDRINKRIIEELGKNPPTCGVNILFADEPTLTLQQTKLYIAPAFLEAGYTVKLKDNGDMYICF